MFWPPAPRMSFINGLSDFAWNRYVGLVRKHILSGTGACAYRFDQECGTPHQQQGCFPWTIFLFTAWFQTGGAITCTPFNASSLNRICIEGLCGRGVFLSIWKIIASMARMLRCVDIQTVFNLFIIIYHTYEWFILGIYHSFYQNIPFLIMVYSIFILVIYHICCKYILGIY